MNQEVIDQLRRLNRQFYRRKAENFSATRQKPWPGWKRVVDTLGQNRRVLDLGCGNGRFAAFLAERDRLPEKLYLGADSSVDLLGVARSRFKESPFQWIAAEVDRNLPWSARFDAILLLAVLHHIPGRVHRREILSTLSQHLEPGGHLVVSLWRRGTDPRMARRIVPWNEEAAEKEMGEGKREGRRVKITESDVENGDFLLTFQGDPETLRYCHLFGEMDVKNLSQFPDLELVRQFDADGRSGEQNTYLIFRRRS